MAVLAWWAVPVVAFLLAAGWAGWAGRARRPADPVRSVRDWQRSRAALGRAGRRVAR